MNRLWVRLSVAFGGLFLMAAVLIVLIVRVSTTEAQAALIDPPPEVAAYMEQVAAQTRSALPNQTVVLVIVVLMAVLAGALMSRELTAPLAELEQAAQAIGRRELDERVSERGSQEMVALASAFNGMAAQLQQAEAQRQVLLGDVAHELRHPVHVLQGNLQAMLDGVYPRDDAELERLVEQTQQLAVLVNDLHVLAQAEARQLPLQKRPTDVAELVKEVAAGYEPLLRAQGKALRVELLGAVGTAVLDEARMRQVLQNLMDNAMRHTEAGGHVLVSVAQDGVALTLTVQDDGVGLAADQLPFVFERMYRADKARTREFSDNVGLGLAISRALVEAHGGTISAASAGPGLGSTFTLRVPLAATTKVSDKP